MSNEKREQQMMAAADAYVEESEEIYNIVEAITDFCAGWRAADAHPQWIPVEDELPKEKQKVIVYMPADERCDHEYMCEALYNYAWHKWEDADEPIELEGVTHWMPLPEAPRKEADND